MAASESHTKANVQPIASALFMFATINVTVVPYWTLLTL